MTCSAVYTNTAPASLVPRVRGAAGRRWRASRRWTRRPSGWASTRSRSGCATSWSPASGPGRRSAASTPTCAADLRLVAEAPRLVDTRRRRVAVGRSASPRRMPGPNRSRRRCVRVQSDGSVTRDRRQHGDRAGLVDGAAADRRRRDGHPARPGPPAPERHGRRLATTARRARRRTTTLMGLAIQRAAARTPRPQLVDVGPRAARRRRPDAVEEHGGRRASVDEQQHDWGDGRPGLVRRGSAASASGGAMSGGPARPQEMPPFWEIGCVGRRGQRRRGDRARSGSSGSSRSATWAARSTRSSSKAQDMGAAIMGLGMAMREELRLRGRRNLLNGNLFEYRVPRAADIPALHLDPGRARRRRRRVRRQGWRRGIAQPGRRGDRQRRLAGDRRPPARGAVHAGARLAGPAGARRREALSPRRGRDERRSAQRSSWMRIRLPAGSRMAQSRTPHGWSVGSWTMSASPACSRSNVPSRSLVARLMPA